MLDSTNKTGQLIPLADGLKIERSVQLSSINNKRNGGSYAKRNSSRTKGKSFCYYKNGRCIALVLLVK